MTAPLAQQGHTYRLGLKTVMAMQSGSGEIRVRVIDERENPAVLGRAFTAHARELTPVPMRYFHGQTSA